jgi:hypothetical protein
MVIGDPIAKERPEIETASSPTTTAAAPTTAGIPQPRATAAA